MVLLEFYDKIHTSSARYFSFRGEAFLASAPSTSQLNNQGRGLETRGVSYSTHQGEDPRMCHKSKIIIPTTRPEAPPEAVNGVPIKCCHLISDRKLETQGDRPQYIPPFGHGHFIYQATHSRTTGSSRIYI